MTVLTAPTSSDFVLRRRARSLARLRAPVAAAASLVRTLLLAALTASAAHAQAPRSAAPEGVDALVVELRDAALNRRKPGAKERLAAARAALAAQAPAHALTPWVEYWDLSTRLAEATPDEVEAFYARWRGSYVEDRLRNDWLLELGKRRDFNALTRDLARFRMNDDREVTCYGLLADHLAGKDVRDAARAAWFAQRDADDGCTMLATAMVDAKRFGEADVWTKARLALEGSRVGAARSALGLLGPAASAAAQEAIANPARVLRRPAGARPASAELRTLATMRLATTDLDGAAAQLEQDVNLGAAPTAWLWSYLARQAAFKLDPMAATYAQRALAAAPRAAEARAYALWTDEALAWNLRALLRGPAKADRTTHLAQLTALAFEPGAPSPASPVAATFPTTPLASRDAAWPYWRARALLATARPGADGDATRAEAQRLLEGIADGISFHGLLATEALGRSAALPGAPAPATGAERDAARTHPGLSRALALVALDLRDEARREWNFSLRGMNERELLAAARLACDAQEWQLCINTAERTREQVDLALRYPLPWAGPIRAAAADAGLDPSFVFGLIRQETRFMPQLRSSVGATGLMQVMPATGRWVARKIGLPFERPVEQLADPATNLKLGTAYLRMMLDDLSGSQAMAAAGYNAGPNRPRRWREGSALDAAAWTDSIPLHETRDYVRKVLTNAAVYEAMAKGGAPALRPRLGATIGPRESDAPAENKDLP